MEETYLDIIKAIHDKPRANIILNSEKPKTFLSDQGQDKDVPSSQLLFNLIL